MADKDAKQTIDNNVQDAELLEKNKQDAQIYRWIWVALVVVVLLSAASIAWFYQQLQQQKADIQSSLNELSSQNGNWQSRVEQHRQQLGRLDTDQKQLAEKLQQLNDKQQLSNAELQKRWALQEVKYLLNVANQRAVLAHDAKGAIQALIMADKQLEALSDYRLHPLRAEIAEELLTLQSLTTSDISGMAIQLQTLAAHVNQLRVKKGPEVDFSASSETADIAVTATPAWKEALSDIWQQLRSLVVIRHEQSGEAAVLASMHKLVDKYEQNSECPVSIDNLSAKTMRQIKGVVGFQIHITDIQAAKKLSQGREHDHPRIIEELEKRDAQAMAVAKAMNDSKNAI